MTGEMHKSEITRDAYPLYFAAADQIPGATVEPFDQYQGPYIHVPGRGRFFLSTNDDDCSAQWYDESADARSSAFYLGLDDAGMVDPWAIRAFKELIESGGTAIDRLNPPVTAPMASMTIDEIRVELAKQGKIAIIWATEDVQTIREDLNDEQALEVLQYVENRHDATLGVNWNTFEDAVGHLFPDDGADE